MSDGDILPPAHVCSDGVEMKSDHFGPLHSFTSVWRSTQNVNCHFYCRAGTGPSNSPSDIDAKHRAVAQTLQRFTQYKWQIRSIWFAFRIFDGVSYFSVRIT